MRIVKAKSERKREILDAATAVFLEKGFAKTTMEDIIAKTTLSKGGVYYYYSNTTDILHDLLIEGMFYRMNMIRDSKRYSDDWDDETLAGIFADKVLDESKLMSLYVIYLQASQRNKDLQNLLADLKEENREVMNEAFGASGRDTAEPFYSDFMLAFMNSIMLGAEVLHAREIFRENRSLLQSMVKLALESLRECKMVT